MMKKTFSHIFLYFLACILLPVSFGFVYHPTTPVATKHNPAIVLGTESALLPLYHELQLQQLGLSEKAFRFAITGYRQLLEKGTILKDHILTVIDFSLPSNQKRLFVIDLLNNQLLFHSFVSHGRNSGKLMANRFSNRANSYQSSIGFFTTGDTYQGKHGFSLRLIGREKGINDKALQRGIVIHSADYANGSVAARQGYLGRSLGCPAIPEDIHEDLIKTIQNGSCFFIYAPITTYAKQSRLI